MHLLFASAYQFIAWHIRPLMPFSTINNISMSVNNSNSTFLIFNDIVLKTRITIHAFNIMKSLKKIINTT